MMLLHNRTVSIALMYTLTGILVTKPMASRLQKGLLRLSPDKTPRLNIYFLLYLGMHVKYDIYKKIVFIFVLILKCFLRLR